MGCIQLYSFLLIFYLSSGHCNCEYILYPNEQNLISSKVNLSSKYVHISSAYEIPMPNEELLGKTVSNTSLAVSVTVPPEVRKTFIDKTYELNVTLVPCGELYSKTYASVLSLRNLSSGNATIEFPNVQFNIDSSVEQTVFCENNVTWKFNLDLFLLCEGCNLKESNSNSQWKEYSVQIRKVRLEFKEPGCDFDQHCSWTYNSTVIQTRSPDDNCTLKSICPSLPTRDASRLASSGYYGFSQKWTGTPTLRSPVIYGSGTKCQLHISHWMYSPTTINVSLMVSSVPLFLASIKHPLMKRRWKNTVINIGRISQQFQVEISFSFDRIPYVALDNLKFTNCEQVANISDKCAENEFQCSTGKCIDLDKVCDLVKDCVFGDDESTSVCGNLPAKSQCAFDNDTCGWENVHQEESTCGLLRTNVARLKPIEIGSPIDRKTSQEDFALLLDGDNCESAVLRSEVYDPFKDNPEKECKIKFRYYLEARGYIDFGICEENASECRLLWHNDVRMSGPVWTRQVVTIPKMERRFAMIFDVNEYMNGDIALDDITLTEGCFIKSDIKQVDLRSNATVEAVQSSKSRKSDLLLTILGAVIGGLIGISTACIIFSAFKRQRKKSLNEPYRKVSAHSSVTSTSMIDEKSAFQIYSSPDHSSSNECDRLVQPPESLAVSSISPYYEWVEQSDAFIRNIPRRKIRLMRLIGKGAFGEVYYGLLADVAHLQKELPVAVKTLPSLCSEQTKSEFFFEALTLSKFKHPNIVRFLGISVDDRSMYLIIELMDGGDLRSFVRDSRPRQPYQPSYLTVQDLLKLAIDVAKGCKYLEENRFIHRDIAARNCLLTEKGPKRVAKIGDFGMARDIFRTNYYRKNGVAMVPVKWMPPEGFLDGVFTSKTDVWAFGVVLWEIFTMGYAPYPGKSNAEVMEFVSNGGRLEKPSLCPSKLYKLMKECWSTEPKQRPGFTEVVRVLERCHKEDELGSLITFEDISSKPENETTQELSHSKSGSSTENVNDKVEYATGLQTCYAAHVDLEDVNT